VEFYVFNLHRLVKAIETAARIGKIARIHIELETGMNRTGFKKEDLDEVIELMQRGQQVLHLQGLCTHYAGAETAINDERVKAQQQVFRIFARKLAKGGIQPAINHTACSAAALRFPDTKMDMARIGILQYGFFPTQEVYEEYKQKNGNPVNPVRRLLKWKSKVMDIKEIQAGVPVGYGQSYSAEKPMTIATIPVGYADGFNRNMSNRGVVLIHGTRCGVVGRVNMNMILVDISHLQGVQLGHEAVLIGNQGDEEITVASFEEITKQVNYEMLTRLPAHIPRVVVE
jgi:alanine racemase